MSSPSIPECTSHHSHPRYHFPQRALVVISFRLRDTLTTTSMRFPILHPHIGKNEFSLDSSGIAGFFGGEEAFAAMNSVHLIPGRRWMGWYNSPGSYIVAKKYGILPDSTFWDGLFPGTTVTPAKLLELDSKSGPRYTGVYSGTQLPATGHLAYLIARCCESNKDNANELDKNITSPPNHDGNVLPETSAKLITSHSSAPVVNPKEKHREIKVTVIDLADVDDENWGENPNSKVPDKYFQPISRGGMIGIMATILFSFASGVLAALYGDWFSFSMILFGAFANGITLLVLRTGDLCLELTSPSEESPAGDGIMWDSKNIIILLGKERIISTILHSGYRLEYSGSSDPSRKYNKIGYCSILLLAQFLFQLFLIPQGKLVGQILFLSMLAMSWICNGYLASFDREKMQTDLLFKIMARDPAYCKFTSHKWSATVAFMMAYFKFKDADPAGILNELIPNNTPSWNLWKSCICAAIKNNEPEPSKLIVDPSTEISPSENMGKFEKEYKNLATKEDKIFVEKFLKLADHEFQYVERVKDKLKQEIRDKTKNTTKKSSTGGNPVSITNNELV